MRLARLLIGIALVLVSVPASAQYGPGPAGRAPYAAQPGARNEAGRFDYYALVLSWSPTFCDSIPRNGYDPQCHSRDGRRYAFVLHGLWPQYERGWPQDCPVRGSTYVPQQQIDRMLEIMPSPRLVIHEYKKHGTCSGLSQEQYFDLARNLFTSVKIPQRFERPNQPFTISTGEVVDAFVEANPGLKPGSIAVVCGSGRGDRLREVRICMSREGKPRDCGPNENPRKLCSRDQLYVLPVRGR